jgi:hypothetical protein
MGDLVVDLGLLESTAGALSMLMEEFSNASRIVDDYAGEIGEPALISALDSFAGNWKAHRGKLLSSMESVYKMATESHQAYLQADDRLARDIKGDKTAPAGSS